MMVILAVDIMCRRRAPTLSLCSRFLFKIMSSNDRSWMYQRKLVDGQPNLAYIAGVQFFIEFSCNHPDESMNDSKLKCPCAKCKHFKYLAVDTVTSHLLRHGFTPGYYEWDKHGEPYNVINNYDQDNTYVASHMEVDETQPIRQMVFDAAGPSFHPTSFENQNIEEDPNPESKKFFDMLNAAEEELWPGCETHSQLSFMSRLLSLKSENNWSDKSFDQLLPLIKEGQPEGSKVPTSFYETKKLVRGLGLPVEKIDCCNMGCMLFWGKHKDLLKCKLCGHQRYKSGKNSTKLTPYKRMYYFPLAARLQRLYASKVTASEMRWHHKHTCVDGNMCHPADSKAWKQFDVTHPSFALEPRNVRLGLCTDGFQPFGQFGKKYSSWPIIVTAYNLPPWMCMKDPYMFLTVIVPGPSNPKHKLDIFLQPLIQELKMLWETGVATYDVSLRNNFQMRAALMWTISDFPAYSMLSGWTTAGLKACPYCMENSQAFSLGSGGKTSWFDNHRQFLDKNHPYRKNKIKFKKNRVENTSPPPIRTGEDILQMFEEFGLLKVTEHDAEEVNGPTAKIWGWNKRSVFWDLPYWKTNLIRHNLDVMHVEKNVFENIFNTVMDIEGKTKDNAKSREDIKSICNRKELEQKPDGKYPKACYALDKSQREVVIDWVQNLKFPNGYVSNLSRCLDMKKYKMFGMKSHDCHIFMQRLIPIAFRELLPPQVWEALTELSLFLKLLTATEITLADMDILEREIPIILCKLESIFPPSLFDSMEHLPVHLPYEAKIAGPVQFRWMYPFERFLRRLKKHVKNKARVEGSICNAYLVEEAATFCSHYFEPHIQTRARKVPRNDDGGDIEKVEGSLNIFSHPGRAYGKVKRRMLTLQEKSAAQSYILLNCEEAGEYIRMFEEHLKEMSPDELSDVQINKDLEKHFASWFYEYECKNHIGNNFIRCLAQGPLIHIKLYPVYFINGFRYHTEAHSTGKSTMNSGVCVSGSSCDYFGILQEIIELEYPESPMKKTVLFKCEWFDPTPNIGTKVHKKYNLVEINYKRRLQKYEPFVLAMQASQVCYVSYPSLRRDKCDWLAVLRVKARGVMNVNLPKETDGIEREDIAYQVNQEQIEEFHISDNEDDFALNDSNAEDVDLEITDDESPETNEENQYDEPEYETTEDLGDDELDDDYDDDSN
ncbi:unnamed protein product [Cuscuta epithymum]|uniref:Uncharacterized protein n=1 Tax=Cuscuta epithymum TaxID=186058 RepID=A0AAV0EIL3_9ASTE|nr:unnamed protein product [Cuscuta epithymum]